jgi:3-phenylpropionate/trans-cinnamate dioxygenase ferredoxin subunit
MLRRSHLRSLRARNERGVRVALPFLPVAKLSDIPSDRGFRIVVDGIGVGLYRVDETIYAMEDACPHAGYPLSEGELSGCVISCRAHGWPFDVRTGFDPDNADGFPVPCFAVEVEGDEIRIDLSTRINDPRRGRGGSNVP